jgi:hypothetical protein
MSEKTAAALARLDVLLPLLGDLPARPEKDELLEAAAALRRAVAAFHMEAIRFRMFTVDRLLRQIDDTGACRRQFDDLRHELESAGFHTRSHTAP